MSEPGAAETHPLFRQRVADERTQIRLTVAVLVRNEHGHILLEKRRDCGLWGMPGGRLEAGESVRETAEREVLEETGFTVRVLGLLGVYSGPADRIISYPDNVLQIVDVLVEAVITGGTLRISDESEAMTFFPVDALPPDAALIPPARRIVRDIVAGTSGVLA